MKTGKKTALMKTDPSADKLFERVVAILEEARANVVRSVNRNMVSAYWLIGQAIVEELQSGADRAEYGKRIIANLSDRLTRRYGEGYSVTTLKYFRTFYLTYSDRNPVISRPTGDLLSDGQKGRPSGDQLDGPRKAFHPNLSWSHYRALMRIESVPAPKTDEAISWNHVLCLFFLRLLQEAAVF